MWYIKNKLALEGSIIKKSEIDQVKLNVLVINDI